MCYNLSIAPQYFLSPMPHQFLPRLALLLSGIVLLSFAIALSIRSDIGTSPVSSAPYVYSLITSFSVGTLTIFLQCIMLVGQLLILGKQFKWFYLFQLPASIVLGVTVDFALSMTEFLQPDIYISKLTLCLLNCALTAIGVSLMLKANLVIMAIDALYFAISQRFGFNFGRCKMWGDITLVCFSLASIWIASGTMTGIGEGTVISAILVGTLIRHLMPYLDFIRFTPPQQQIESQA